MILKESTSSVDSLDQPGQHSYLTVESEGRLISKSDQQHNNRHSPGTVGSSADSGSVLWIPRKCDTTDQNWRSSLCCNMDLVRCFCASSILILWQNYLTNPLEMFPQRTNHEPGGRFHHFRPSLIIKSIFFVSGWQHTEFLILDEGFWEVWWFLVCVLGWHSSPSSWSDVS